LQHRALLHPTNQLDRAIAWADERREVIPRRPLLMAGGCA
jgi:hypothetical protein